MTKHAMRPGASRRTSPICRSCSNCRSIKYLLCVVLSIRLAFEYNSPAELFMPNARALVAGAQRQVIAGSMYSRRRFYLIVAKSSFLTLPPYVCPRFTNGRKPLTRAGQDDQEAD